MDPSIDPRLEAKAKARGEKSYELVARYLRRFPYENVNAADVPSNAYDVPEDDEDEWDDLIEIDPNPHEKFMRFLKQVRESNGYDVDCAPPKKYYSPFFPIDIASIKEDQRFRERLMRVAHYIIDKINTSEGKHSEFVEVVKVVQTMCMDMLLTLSVEDADDNSIKTLRAMLKVPFGYGPDDEFELLEWRLESPTPAADKSPENMEPVKKKAEIEEGKDFSE